MKNASPDQTYTTPPGEAAADQMASAAPAPAREGLARRPESHAYRTGAGHRRDRADGPRVSSVVTVHVTTGR